jgi:hypothetical protein
MRLAIFHFLTASFLTCSFVSVLSSQEPPKSPVVLTAQQDRQIMLDQLKIPGEMMRKGPSGMNPKAPDFQNTDEAKANPWPHLPELMVTKSRKTVDSAEVWWKVRRPEIVEYFDAEVYGRVPKEVPKVTWEIAPAKEVPKSGGFGGPPKLDIPNITKHLVGRVDSSAYPAFLSIFA